MNPDRIKLSKYKQQLQALEAIQNKGAQTKQKIAELKSKMAALEAVFKFNGERKQLYKDDHHLLEDDDETAVMTLDFFKAECGNAGEHDFHDLIAVFASKNKLELPQSLLGEKISIHFGFNRLHTDEQIEEVEPLSTLTEDQIELLLNPPEKTPPVKKLKPKQEVKDSHRAVLASKRKIRTLPPLDITDANNYVPELTYFHCIANKGISPSRSYNEIHFEAKRKIQ